MIGYASGLGTDAQAQLTHYKLRVDSSGNVSAKNSLQINGTTVIDVEYITCQKNHTSKHTCVMSVGLHYLTLG